MKLVIGTFNIQNRYRVKHYDGRDDFGDHTKELIDFILKNDIDILGVQELVKRYHKRLKENLSSTYQVVGKYRYTKVSNYLPVLSKYNEKASIITKHKVLNTKTKHLPFLPNIPRIVTISQLLIENEKIIVMNTHLDYTSTSIQKKQLKKLLELVKQYPGKLVLMGDFNLSVDDDIFKEFIDNMKVLGINHILPKGRTHNEIEQAIDHIFLSESMKVVRGPVIDESIPNASDHYPVLIEVEF